MMISSALRLRRILAVMFAACVCATGMASAQTSVQERQLQSLTEAGQALSVRSTATDGGFAGFAIAEQQGILLTLPATAPAIDRARGFVAQYGAAFGLGDASQLQLVSETRDALGFDHVRFRQTHLGVPVTAGEFVVHLKGSRVLVANGRVIGDLPDAVTPLVPASDAEAHARAFIQKHQPARAADALYSVPRLEIFNRGALEDAPYPSRLAWFVEVTGPALRQYIWIDAGWGAILLNFSQLTDAKNRSVYTASGGSTLPGTLVRSEGGPATANTDQDLAYTYAGATYDYYLASHGRDSFDNAGGAIISTTNYCPTVSDCPHANAFWNGTQMVYGAGFASADDVVAHELTHAVIEHSANLFYYGQSGALNESFADIFGEIIDLADGLGNDAASVRWLLGEDLAVGASRNMMTPTQFGDPGKASDAQFVCSASDGGGVHSNSGVPNHAFALMVDGGAYNGRTIVGIGSTKAAKVQYRALTTYLTSGSRFVDAYTALNQSCTDLVGTNGITASDCTQVSTALEAVEMSNPSACSLTSAAPPLCPSGAAPTAYTLQEGFESGAPAWSVSSTTATTWGLTKDAARTGLWSAYGINVASVSDHSLQMTSAITVPAAGRMAFDHLFKFEYGTTTNYDGGVLEYSTNDGSTWNDAGSLIDAGKAYGGTLSSSFSNPLAGRSAFVKETLGYTGTRLNLQSLAGQSVRFRFRVGTDNAVASTGWVVDNVAIYSCSASDSCTYGLSATSASPAATANSGSVTVTPSSNTCAWGAKSNASWITITSGGSGTGTGSVDYAVSANPLPTSRTGTLTIGGQTFTVTQVAAGSIVTGSWNGETNQGRTYTFSLNGTPALTTSTYSWSNSCGTVTATTNFGTPQAIANGGFSYSSSTCPSVQHTGTFLTPTAATGTMVLTYVNNGFSCFCSGTVTHTWTATAGGAPAIITDPIGQTVASGQDAMFTAVAVGNATLTYQWQLSTDGTSFSNVTNSATYGGATTTTLTVTGVTASLNGTRYRLVATNGSGSATSSAATLSLLIAPGISTHPSDQSIVAGQNAQFTVAATGTPAPTHQWQVSVNGGSSWTDVTNTTPYSGVTSATLVITGATTALTSYKYRAIATNSAGTATSNAATLTVSDPATAPAINTHPSSRNVMTSQDVSFTVAVTGTPTPTHQWQISTDSGTTWTNLTNSATYGGVTTAAMTVTGPEVSLSGSRYRAVVSNSAGTVQSNSATLTVNALPPAGSPATGTWIGTTAQGRQFDFGITGSNLTSLAYSAQIPNCFTITSTISSTTPVAGNAFSLDSSGTCPRAQASGTFSSGAAASGTLQLTFTPAPFSCTCSGTFSTTWTAAPSGQPVITTHPAAQSVVVGQNAQFTVIATGSPDPAYRWQTSTDGGATWTDVSGATSATLTVTGPAVTSSGTRFRAVASNSAGTATSTAALLSVSATPPTISLDRTSMTFGATTTGAAFSSQTGSQAVRLIQTGIGTVSWTASSNSPWLLVSPSAGTGSATLTISTQFVTGLNATQTGTVTFTFNGAGNTAGPVTVTLNIVNSAQAVAPQGAVDTPTDNLTGVTGSIGVTGWAIDDVEVVRVRILRDPVAGEDPNQLVFIGNAVLVDGARPDIQGLFPASPRNTRAGWGYLLLTNFLPALGNGTFRLVAIADDADGRSTILGSKTITCTNATATAPFGAIDTPGQGDTISGSNYVNFGWVLAPGTRRADPPSGGQVRVVIDGVIGDAPTGWVSRSDLTGLFPAAQYAGVANALGIIGINTTLLTNGVHTLSWLVTDNSTPPQASGIGSRYFTVSNGALYLDPEQGSVTTSTGSTVISGPARLSMPAAAAHRLTSAALLTAEVNDAPSDVAAIRGRRGYNLDTPVQPYAFRDGVATIQSEELDRIELRLSRSAGHSYAGYLRANGSLAPLPIGSALNASTGLFTWQPGVGFIGSYDLVFVRWAEGRAVAKQDVRVVLNPKGSNRIGPQVIIDLPGATDGAVADGFIVAGWAADLDSAIDVGVDAVHVWAYPADGGDPIFVGPAAVGGTRPDVAAVYGDRFAKSGYGIRVKGLAPGAYDIAVFAYSTVTGGFVPAKTVRVTVR